MFEPQETQVLPSGQLLAGLTALLAIGGPFATPTLQLWKNPITPNRDTPYSAFVIADFQGYADVPGVTFSAPYFDVDGTALALGGDHAFIATGGATPNTIYGYLLANVGLTVLYASYKFTSPVGVAATGQGVAVVPFLRYSGV